MIILSPILLEGEYYKIPRAYGLSQRFYSNPYRALYNALFVGRIGRDLVFPYFNSDSIFCVRGVRYFILNHVELKINRTNSIKCLQLYDFDAGTITFMMDINRRPSFHRSQPEHDDDAIRRYIYHFRTDTDFQVTKFVLRSLSDKFEEENSEPVNDSFCVEYSYNNLDWQYMYDADGNLLTFPDRDSAVAAFSGYAPHEYRIRVRPRYSVIKSHTYEFGKLPKNSRPTIKRSELDRCYYREELPNEEEPPPIDYREAYQISDLFEFNVGYE